MVLEELWCTVLWFHPLARVLVSRLDLAREILVDRCVVAATGDRPVYAKALSAFAHDRPAVRTVTLFIRSSHLAERIAALSQEVRMSRRLTLAVVSALGLLVTTATAATLRLVPMAPAQEKGVTLPRPIYEEKPQYTAAAMNAKIEGTVLLAVVVEADGTVGSVEITRSLDTVYGLDDAAVYAARQWRFEPGRVDGKPVPVEVTLEFTFTLRN
jgi:TonB family protein